MPSAAPAWFLTSTVVATVLATSANYVLKLWDEGRARRQQGVVEALRVAVVLERYAADCAELVGNHEAWKERSPFARPPSAVIPAAPALPAVDWRSLPIRTASEVIALENEIHLVTASLTELSMLDPDGAAATARMFAGKYGRKALGLAVGLRAQFRLPALSLELVEWDFRDQLRAEVGATEG